MAENMGKWASGNRKIAKSGYRVAAEMVPFPRRWHGGMISANKEAIWGMSVQESIAHLLTRPTGRPPNHVRRYYVSFSYQAGSWDRNPPLRNYLNVSQGR